MPGPSATWGIWDSLAPDLFGRDVLPFARYCEAKADCTEARPLIAASGRLIRVPVVDGRSRTTCHTRVEVNPAVRLLRQASEEANHLAGPFGLTPANRSQVRLGATRGGTAPGPTLCPTRTGS